MERLLSGVGAVLCGILGKFLPETCELVSSLLSGEPERIDRIIKVLAPVEMTMVAVIHFTFVHAAIGISLAERLTREKT